MSESKSIIDSFAIGWTRTIIKYRYLVIVVALLAAFGIGSGGKLLQFSSNYRVFFSGENPELAEFESFQSKYTKNDNFLFVIEPADEKVFSNEILSAVEGLTNEAWKIPFANRVDSITNFQHSYSIEDDLIVEDLVEGANALSSQEIERIKKVALAEPLLVNQLVTSDGGATAINVVLQYPDKSLMEVPSAVKVARELKAKYEESYPGIDISLTGFSMLNNAFAEAGFMDSVNLMPKMFLVFIVFTFLAMRSFFGLLASLFVVVPSVMVGMGVGGYSGVLLTPVSNSAPIIILTLAIADSVHLLTSIKKSMRNGLARHDAIVEAVRFNFLPITVTSLTTIVGFLSLNFADSPPYWHLGNMSSAGILAAWLLSLTVFPALISLLPIKQKANQEPSLMDIWWSNLAALIAKNTGTIAVVFTVLCIALVAMIPKIQLEDSWSDYFSKKIEFRNETDQATKKFGLYPIEFSVPSQGVQGVADPEYMGKLDSFANFLRLQDNVRHVYSITDIMKRLNKNMHGDDESFYSLPQDKQQAAQYLLLYELSLPYGLDLNDRINIDKSASRVTVLMNKVTTKQTREFIDAANGWMTENFPEYMKSRPTSGQVMFSYIAERNVDSMINGTLVAILAIGAILGMALKSVRLGVLSLVPNFTPIIVTFGVWSILVGTVGFSVAAVAAISLGIVVDDTVYFLTKYNYARNQKHLSTIESIEYTLKNVGQPIVFNSVILMAGFFVMSTSNFKISADLGLLTLITIFIAMVFDLLMLPALLLLLDKEKKMSNSVNNAGVSGGTLSGVSTAIATLMLCSAGMFYSADSVAGESKAEDSGRGYEIFARSDRSDRGFGDSEVQMRMVLKNAANEETVRNLIVKTLEMADENLGDKSLVYFDTPKDIEGTTLLSHAKILDSDNQWIYLPSLKRVKRISSKNKSGPFVGSEFAFEDITSLELNKYSHEWLREEGCQGMKCDVVESKPRYKYSGYTKLMIWIDQEDYQVRQIKFYDRRGDNIKTLSFKDYKQYDKYWRAQVLSMENHLTNKSTTLYFNDYKFKVGLNEKDFVKGKLGKL